MKTKGNTMKDSISAYSKQKSLVKKVLKNENFEDIQISNGYYYFSGFAKKNEHIIYFSIGDTRTNILGNKLLVRTAKNYKDFTGGSNNFCNMNDSGIAKLANTLTKKETL
jgi:c-di-GMP-related signal transduction protein